MNKKGLKIFFAIMSVLMLISFSTMSLAYNPDDFGGTRNATGTYGSVQGGATKIIGIIQAIGITVAVIMLVMMAIKYVSGAPEGKAEIKKTLIPYAVGAVLLFATTGVLEIVKTFAGEIT